MSEKYLDYVINELGEGVSICDDPHTVLAINRVGSLILQEKGYLRPYIQYHKLKSLVDAVVRNTPTGPEDEIYKKLDILVKFIVAGVYATNPRNFEPDPVILQYSLLDVLLRMGQEIDILNGASPTEGEFFMPSYLRKLILVTGADWLRQGFLPSSWKKHINPNLPLTIERLLEGVGACVNSEDYAVLNTVSFDRKLDLVYGIMINMPVPPLDGFSGDDATSSISEASPRISIDQHSVIGVGSVVQARRYKDSSYSSANIRLSFRFNKGFHAENIADIIKYAQNPKRGDNWGLALKLSETFNHGDSLTGILRRTFKRKANVLNNDEECID